MNEHPSNFNLADARNPPLYAKFRSAEYLERGGPAAVAGPFKVEGSAFSQRERRALRRMDLSYLVFKARAITEPLPNCLAYSFSALVLGSPPPVVAPLTHTSERR